jgi:GNAT superfamily N-acetyltransferase
MNIRRANPSDLDQVVSLFDAYRQFYGRASDVEGARRFLTERFEKNDSVVYAALGNGRCIGFTQLFPSFSSVAMQRVWILNDLFVMPEYRRLGVGAALIDAAIDFGRRDGAVRLDLATATDNAEAQAVYESLRWKRDSAFMHYKYSL